MLTVGTFKPILHKTELSYKIKLHSPVLDSTLYIHYIQIIYIYIPTKRISRIKIV